MNSAEAIQNARDAHYNMGVQREAFMWGADVRDAAIINARNIGVSAQEIAAALSLSRQQVHKIIAAHATGPTMSDLA